MSENSVELLIKAKDEAGKVVNAITESFKKLGDQTDKSSKQMAGSQKELAKLESTYASLKKTVSELSVLKNLADQLQKASDASERTSDSFDKSSKALKAQKTDIKSAADAYAKANEQWLKSKSSLDKLTIAAKKDKDAIVGQRDEIRRLAEARKVAGAELRSQESALNSITNTYKKSSAEKIKAAKRLSDLSEEAKKSGISLSNLSKKSKEFGATIKSANSGILKTKNAINAQTVAIRKNSKATAASVKSMSMFNRESRQSMSVVQRVRGEILSMTAAYVGLYGIVNQTVESFRSYNEQQGALAKFTSAYDGDQKLAAEEMEFVSSVAERLGLDLKSLEKSYSSFFVAAKLGGEEAQFIRAMFENMAEGAAVNKLSVDQFNGSMTAMIQIMSKGQVMAEELQGQLAERFPGAVSLFAKSMDKTTAELRKMMEQGLLTSDQLLGFTVTVSESIAAGLDIASGSLLANFNRLGNAATDLKRHFATLSESGLNEVIAELNERLSGEGGVKLVEMLASAFEGLGRAIIFTMDNVDNIIIALKVIIAMKIASVILAIASAFSELKKSSGNAGKLMGIVAGQIVLIASALSAVFKVLESKESFDSFVFYAKYSFGIIEASFSKLKEYMSDPLDISLAHDKSYFGELHDEIQRIEDRLKGVGAEKLISGDVGLDLQKEFDTNSAAEKLAAEKKLAAAEAERRLASLNANKEKVEKEKEIKALMKEFYSLESQYLKRSASSLADQKALINSKYSDLLFNLEVEGKFEEVSILNKAKKFELDKLATDFKKQADKDEAKRIEDRDKLIDDARKKSIAAINSEQMALSLSMDQRAAKMDEIAALREQGSIESIIQADALESSLEKIDLKSVDIVNSVIEMWQAVGGTEADIAILKLQSIKKEIEKADKSMINMEQKRKEFAGGAADSMVEFGKGMADVIRGSGSLSDAFSRAGVAFREFASDFLINMGKMILQTLILKAIQDAMSRTSTPINVQSPPVTQVSSSHNGGIAGSSNQVRSFVNGITKYHNGGIAGLRPNEVMTVLEKGEEVLTADDPRHRYNGGGGGSTSIQIIDQRGTDSPDIERTSSNEGGMESITLLIKESVEQSMNNGSLDMAMGQFSAGRRGIKR